MNAVVPVRVYVRGHQAAPEARSDETETDATAPAESLIGQRLGQRRQVLVQGISFAGCRRGRGQNECGQHREGDYRVSHGAPLDAPRRRRVSGLRGRVMARVPSPPQVQGEIVPNYKLRPAMAEAAPVIERPERGRRSVCALLPVRASEFRISGFRFCITRHESRNTRHGLSSRLFPRFSGNRGGIDTAGLHHAPDERAHLFADGHRRRRGRGLDVGPGDAVGALDLADQAAGRGAFDLDIVPLQIDARKKTGSIFRRGSTSWRRR